MKRYIRSSQIYCNTNYYDNGLNRIAKKLADYLIKHQGVASYFKPYDDNPDDFYSIDKCSKLTEESDAFDFVNLAEGIGPNCNEFEDIVTDTIDDEMFDPSILDYSDVELLRDNEDVASIIDKNSYGGGGYEARYDLYDRVIKYIILALR